MAKSKNGRKNMRRYESGVTFLGWLFILIPMALVLYAVICLAPVYLEYMKIARTLEQVPTEFQGDQPSPGQIRVAIERRFDIEDVRVINKDTIKIQKEGSGFTVEAAYKDSAPYISNVSLQAEFKKTV